MEDVANESLENAVEDAIESGDRPEEANGSDWDQDLNPNVSDCGYQ